MLPFLSWCSCPPAPLESPSLAVFHQIVDGLAQAGHNSCVAGETSHNGEGGHVLPLLSFVLRVLALRSQVSGRYYRSTIQPWLIRIDNAKDVLCLVSCL